MELAIKDIKEILDNENNLNDPNNSKFCFFNAKYFCDYCNEYEYFFNLEKTFESEYKKFLDYKNNIYKYPELFRGKIYHSFYDFLYNQLNDKLKNKFATNVKKIKSYNINKNVESQLYKIFNNYFGMEEILKKGNKIVQIFSYGQDKVKELNTFKESNIEQLKNLLNTIINDSYNNIKEEFIKKIDNLLLTLDKFFEVDSSGSNLNESKIEEIKIKIIQIKIKLSEISNYSQDKFKEKIKSEQKFIEFILKDKKDHIKESLKNNSVKTILEEIEKEMAKRIKELSNNINAIIIDINNSIKKLFKEGNEYLDKLSEGKKTNINLIFNFSDYLLIEIGDKNKTSILDQIFGEIKKANNLSKIYTVKGFGNFIKSAISNKYYLKNNIEIILEESIAKTKYIISLLIDNLIRYIQSLLNMINKIYDFVSLNLTYEQSEIWKGIGDFYHSIKPQIEEAKIKLINNEFE